jgi:hypothetical protein
MAQWKQVLDRAQRLQQAFVNRTLRKQARHRLGLYCRLIGLIKRRFYRNAPNVTVLMYRHLPFASGDNRFDSNARQRVNEGPE